MRQASACSRRKLLIRHHLGKDLSIARHSRDEQLVQHTIQVGGEVREAVGVRGLRDALVVLHRSPYLIEEQLIRLREVGSETLVQAIDQPRERHLLVLGAGGADIGRPLQRIDLSFR